MVGDEVRPLHRSSVQWKGAVMRMHLNMMKCLGLLFMVEVMLVGTVLPVRAEDRLLEGAMILAPVGESARMANDANDTLTTCLARIPAELPPQQRLLAQQMCQNEETTRKLLPVVVEKEGD
jgi:hypothetical protein